MYGVVLYMFLYFDFLLYDTYLLYDEYENKYTYVKYQYVFIYNFRQSI